MFTGARCIGPALGGALWSLGVKHELIVLNFIFVFFLLSLCLGIGTLLPASVDSGDSTHVSSASSKTTVVGDAHNSENTVSTSCNHQKTMISAEDDALLSVGLNI